MYEDYDRTRYITNFDTLSPKAEHVHHVPADLDEDPNEGQDEDPNEDPVNDLGDSFD